MATPAPDNSTRPTNMPSIETAIVPTAAAATFSRFGSSAAKQFNRGFNRAANFAMPAVASKFAAGQASRLRSQVNFAKESDAYKGYLKKQKDYLDTERKLKFTSDRLRAKKERDFAGWERAQAFTAKRELDMVKAQRKVNDLIKKSGSNPNTRQQEAIKYAKAVSKLAAKDYEVAKQREASSRREYTKTFNSRIAAKAALADHRAATQETLRLSNLVRQNQAAQRIQRNDALRASVRSSFASLGSRGAAAFTNSFQTVGRQAITGFANNSRRVLSRAVSAPFRGGNRNSGRNMFAMGRTDGRNYSNAFGVATRNIKSKLLTGALPNHANLAALVRGQMIGTEQAGARAGNLFTRAFATATGGIKTALTTTLVGASLAVGSIVSGGLTRALNIEDAQAKLRGLNYTGQQVQNIMSNVNDAVLGTKFSLDQGVGVAAGALAAGIKPGQELTKYLQTTADAATIAGVSMDQLGRIMNKTTANDKLMAQEGNQFADKGLPIWSWLAKNRGITVKELRNLTEQGKISAAELREVIEKNIGGVALKSAETTRGAFTNMRVAYARLGATLVGGALPAVRQVFVENMKLADFMKAKFGPTLDKFWAKWGPRSTQEVANFGATIQKLISGGYNSSTTVVAIKNVINALKDLGKNILNLEPIQFFWDKVKDIFRNEDGSAKSFKQFGQDIIDGSTGMGRAIKNVYDWLMKTTGDPNNLINVVWRNLLDLFEALKPAIKDLLPVLGLVAATIGTALGETLKQLMPALVENLPKLATAIGDAMIQAGPVIADMLPKLPGLITALATGAIVFIEKLIPFLVEFLPKLLELIGKIGDLLIKVLPPLTDFLTKQDGLGLAVILALLLGVNAQFLFVSAALIAASVVVYGIVMSIATLLTDIAEFFKTGKFGANFAGFIAHSFGLEDSFNPGDRSTEMIDMMTGKSTQRKLDAVGAAKQGLNDPTANPWQQYNTYNMNVTNNSDVDAQRSFEQMQKLMQNKPGG